MTVSKPVVAILDPHPPEVRAIIAAECPPEVALRMATSSAPAELRALTADAEFLVGGVTPISAALIDAAPNLRLIQKWGIGVDKIDLAAARARGVPVAITAGANAVPVAEFTLLLMLAVLRRLPHRGAQLRAGEWWRARAEARAHALQLAGKIVGVIGMGPSAARSRSVCGRSTRTSATSTSGVSRRRTSGPWASGSRSLTRSCRRQTS